MSDLWKNMQSVRRSFYFWLLVRSTRQSSRIHPRVIIRQMAIKQPNMLFATERPAVAIMTHVCMWSASSSADWQSVGRPSSSSVHNQLYRIAEPILCVRIWNGWPARFYRRIAVFDILQTDGERAVQWPSARRKRSKRTRPRWPIFSKRTVLNIFCRMCPQVSMTFFLCQKKLFNNHVLLERKGNLKIWLEIQLDSRNLLSCQFWSTSWRLIWTLFYMDFNTVF